MIVSAGECHHFADAQDGAGFLSRALIFGRIVDGPGRNDGALTGHEPRVGCHGADGARVSERDGGALEVGGRQAAFSGARNQIVEGVEILLEVEGRGVLDAGHHEHARAVFAKDVDRDPQVDMPVHRAEGLPVFSV